MKNALLICGLILCSVAGAVTNEIVQCWAVTKSGNRCKRRAVVNERYCKQHSATRTSSTQPDRCRSMTTNGVRCAEKPVLNRAYCQQHLK